MIKPIPRQTPFFKSLTVFCFLVLIRAHTFIEKAKIFQGHRYTFNQDAFFNGIFLCLAIAIVIFFYLKAKTKMFWINNDCIEIKFYLRKKMQLLLSEISSISWGSNEKAVTNWRLRRYSVASRNDSITITFNNGFILNFGVNDYTNFDELRTWFLNYGTKNGIIKLKPIHKRGRG